MSRSPALVAIDLPPGPDFVAALQAAWDRGEAVLPIDQRLPPPARRALVARLLPASVVGPGDPLGAAGTRCDGAVPVEPGDALVVPTSGTTGEPKGVVLTAGAVAAHARAVHRRLGVDPSVDRWLSCLPLAHVGGLGVVTRAIVDGTGLEVHAGFEVEAVLDAARRGATLTSLVPTALDRLPAQPFRWVVLGGSADARERPPSVVRTYGMTETGGGVVYDGEPLPFDEPMAVRIGDDGSIALRCPSLLRAYRTDPGVEGPAGTDPLGPDGFLDTGDVGAFDGPGGRLVLRGRRGDLIISGGENVWPEPVEDVLRAAPGVRDVAVVGRPDPEWGQRVVAVVVPVDRDHPPALEDLRAVVKEALAPWCAPRVLEVVDALPRTALGKVRRSALG